MALPLLNGEMAGRSGRRSRPQTPSSSAGGPIRRGRSTGLCSLPTRTRRRRSSTAGPSTSSRRPWTRSPGRTRRSWEQTRRRALEAEAATGEGHVHLRERHPRPLAAWRRPARRAPVDDPPDRARRREATLRVELRGHLSSWSLRRRTAPACSTSRTGRRASKGVAMLPPKPGEAPFTGGANS